MKFIPILFSTPMVQAIIEGRKTMTRRVIKPQPILGENRVWQGKGKSCSFGFTTESATEMYKLNGSCPYGQIGDVLWVRETFLKHPIPNEGYKFKANYSIEQLNTSIFKNKILKWKPSLFMPKAACRIFLKITEIRVERLQDITNEDSLKEGIEIGETVKSPLSDNNLQTYKNYLSDEFKWYAPKLSFNTLWQSINGKDSWEANPWVWVICFERIEKPTGLKYFFFRN